MLGKKSSLNSVKQQYKSLGITYVDGGPYGPPVRVARSFITYTNKLQLLSFTTFVVCYFCPKFTRVNLCFQLGRTKSCFNLVEPKVVCKNLGVNHLVYILHYKKRGVCPLHGYNSLHGETFG